MDWLTKANRYNRWYYEKQNDNDDGSDRKPHFKLKVTNAPIEPDIRT